MSPALLTTAGELGSSTLFEASGLRCSLDQAIRPICPGLVLVGEAYPLSCAPGDNLAIHIALEKAPAGSVLVIDASGFVAGYWGEVLTVAAQARGIAGLVMDGGVRDIAAMNRRGFPVFTRGISVQGTVKARFNSVGEPIQISGCGISQGDLVVADDDGVVVIPKAHIERVITAGKARADKEALMMGKLAAGATTLELLGLQKWR
jgi:4-hydroxy-4-methyl-2-oxoglutarate aldolase